MHTLYRSCGVCVNETHSYTFAFTTGRDDALTAVHSYSRQVFAPANSTGIGLCALGLDPCTPGASLFLLGCVTVLLSSGHLHLSSYRGPSACHDTPAACWVSCCVVWGTHPLHSAWARVYILYGLHTCSGAIHCIVWLYFCCQGMHNLDACLGRLTVLPLQRTVLTLLTPCQPPYALLAT
jgi:hypothetical protein